MIELPFLYITKTEGRGKYFLEAVLLGKQDLALVLQR